MLHLLLLESYIIYAGHLTILSFQGVYVLSDSSFRPFSRMSMAVRSEAVTMAQAVGLLDFQIPVNQTNYRYSTFISHAALSGVLLQT